MTEAHDAALTRARSLFAEDRIDEAYAAYLAVLQQDPSNRTVLHELGCLAHAREYRSAARTLFEELVRQWPDDIVGRTNLGNILYEFGELKSARGHFEAALRLDGDCVDAHRGLGRVLFDLGESALADNHWRRSFSGQAIVPQLYRGPGIGTPLLLLVSAKGGNIPTRHLLDDRIFAVTTLYAEYYKDALPLPPAAQIFNAIGDADFCAEALEIAERIVRRVDAPTINLPDRVRLTGRADNARRLGHVSGVRTPRILQLPRARVAEAAALGFPLLLRSPGFHTGQHFVRVNAAEEISAAAAGLPGDELLAIEYLDASGPEGMSRKYRVMAIGGVLYPVHLAISADWKVHYFTADNAGSAAHLSEEQAFLENMTKVLGGKAMAALAAIAQLLDLDYAGMDFAVDADGTVLLFEANATMVINPVTAGPEYRRGPINKALQAAQTLLQKAC